MSPFSTRTSTSATADFNVCVRCSSAREGSGDPLGWLCTSRRALEFRLSASLTTSRGYTNVWLTVPRNIST